MREKGKGLATVIPEVSLSDQLSSDPKLDRAVQPESATSCGRCTTISCSSRFRIDSGISCINWNAKMGKGAMTPEPALRDALLAAVPSLRAFAISLCGQVDRVDDLVQDTLLRALFDIDRFEPRYQPQRVAFYDPTQPLPLGILQAPPRGRGSGRASWGLKVQPNQASRLDFEDFPGRSPSCRTTSGRPSPGRRFRIFLRGGGHICGCAVGTIKSRVNRARVKACGPSRSRRGRRSRSRRDDPRRAPGHRQLVASTRTGNAARGAALRSSYRIRGSRGLRPLRSR